MRLVIAEKPSVALALAAVVGARKRCEGYFEGPAVRVTWALGHLVQIAMPHEIDGAWRDWSAEQLPMLPREYPLVARDTRSRQQLALIRKLARDPQILELVNAADAGREGELVFRYIMEAIGVAKPCKRLWTSSLTEQALRDAWRSLRPSTDFDALGDAARARSEADWLVGMNLSRALRLATRREFSVGRVQTPTLAMIVERDAAIRAFTAESYAEVHVELLVTDSSGSDTPKPEVMHAVYVRPLEDANGNIVWDRRIFVERVRAGEVDDPELIKARAHKGEASVRAVNREQKVIQPPLLFDLTSLQRVANERWAWTAAETLSVAQELYEQHRLITYPRTSSRHLTSSVAATLSPIVEMLRPQYEECIAQQTGRFALSQRFVDDAKVGDHHAIIPTLTPPTAIAAETDVARLYDVVCRRFLAAWQSPQIVEVAEAEFEIVESGICDRYHARGSVVVELGWRLLEPVRRAATKPFFAGLTMDSDVYVESAKPYRKRTDPPSPFTDGTLLAAMERAGAPSDGARAPGAPLWGLGTVATRAAILEQLLARGYVARRGNTLVPTAHGCALIAAVHPSVKTPELTGVWEERIARIERGEDAYDSFRADVEQYVAECVAEVLAAGAGSAARQSRRAASAPPSPLRETPRLVRLR